MKSIPWLLVIFIAGNLFITLYERCQLIYIYYSIFSENDDFWWTQINSRICHKSRKTGAYGTLWNKSERTLHCQEVSAN